MDQWKTSKGTTLYLINLKGKPYLPVAERLVWFREDHPDWTIETEIFPKEDECLAKATIKNESGKIIATAHKFENRKGFADFIEKSETGSIGRALALCGFGTQFCADDFSEHDRIVDSPRNSNPAPNNSNKNLKPSITPQVASDVEYVIDFGEDKGKTLNQLGGVKVSSKLKFIKETNSPWKSTDQAKAFMAAAEAYLKGK